MNSVIRSLVDAIDGVSSSSKMFGQSQPVADRRAEILREKYSSKFEIAESSESSPLSSFFKNVVNKTAWSEDVEAVKPTLIEGLGSSKPYKKSIVEGLGNSSLYDSIEVASPKSLPRVVYKEAPIIIGTNDEQCIESIREELSAGSIHESTIHDYVKMAYLYRRKLINNNSSNLDKEI